MYVYYNVEILVMFKGILCPKLEVLQVITRIK